MKRFLFSLTCLILLFSVGCSDLTEKNQEEHLIPVSLNLKGDFDVEVTKDPLTKAASNDAYGINVYYMTKRATGLRMMFTPMGFSTIFRAST